MPKLRSYAPSVSLFTADEYHVLCEWFGVDHPASDRWVEDILDEWHVPHEIAFYRRSDAAVAQILLERIQHRLPTAWISWSGLTRSFFDRRAQRKVELLPTHLFTINWANTAPGLSWPVAYNATIVPGFDRTVVTASADGTDAFGVCDVAIGSFGPEVSILQGSREIIVADWLSQFASHDQQRWQYLEYAGLVSDAEVRAWADEVWPETREQDEESDDEQEQVSHIITVVGYPRPPSKT